MAPTRCFQWSTFWAFDLISKRGNFLLKHFIFPSSCFETATLKLNFSTESKRLLYNSILHAQDWKWVIAEQVQGLRSELKASFATVWVLQSHNSWLVEIEPARGVRGQAPRLLHDNHSWLLVRAIFGALKGRLFGVLKMVPTYTKSKNLFSID